MSFPSRNTSMRHCSPARKLRTLASMALKYGIADPDGVARTLSARYYKDGSEILIAQDGKNPRRLTPRECARLQGFPDDFKIPVSDTQAYKQFGNSVVVPLMSDVAGLVATKLSELDRRQTDSDEAVIAVVAPAEREVMMA